MIYVNARAIIERRVANQTQLVIQLRTKKGQEKYEFPGGQVNPYESLFDALKREVKEETGLDIVEATGQGDLIETEGSLGFRVECFKPYAVYQTLRGPVDSMGVFFRCRAEGELLPKGDDTEDIKWVTLDELRALLAMPNAFSDVDRAGAMFYLKENGR